MAIVSMVPVIQVLVQSVKPEMGKYHPTNRMLSSSEALYQSDEAGIYPTFEIGTLLGTKR